MGPGGCRCFASVVRANEDWDRTMVFRCGESVKGNLDLTREIQNGSNKPSRIEFRSETDPL